MRSHFVPILLAVVLGACASAPRPTPLTADQVVHLSKDGRSAQEIIEALQRTDTVILLSATDIVRLHQAGVPQEVLDHLQRAQIDEIRLRDRFSHMHWYGPFYRGYGPCPWPYLPGLARPYRGGPWGC